MSNYQINFGKVAPVDWGNKPVAIVGGGSSLKDFDFQRLRLQYTVLAVNASMLDLPWADAGFSLDRRAMRDWWPKLRQLTIPQYYAVPDLKLKNFNGSATTYMTFVRRIFSSEFSQVPRYICSGGTSGYGALQLAYLKGAKDITLFGFDYGAINEEWHHNEGHYKFYEAQDDKKWEQWAKNFDRAAIVLEEQGVKVMNASPKSRITAFPKISIEEALS